MEDRQLLKALSRPILLILIAAMWSLAHGDMISPPPARGLIQFSAPQPRVGSEFVLTFSLDFPGKAPVPLEVGVSLPEGIDVVHSDLEIFRTGGSTEARWRGIQTERKEWTMRLKPVRPGFYRIGGTVSLPRDDPDRLKGVQDEIVQNIPGLQGSGEDVIQRRKDFIKSGQGLKIVSDSLAFSPEAVYLKVWRDGGRVEGWDFGSLWKRIKHWWRH